MISRMFGLLDCAVALFQLDPNVASAKPAVPAPTRLRNSALSIRHLSCWGVSAKHDAPYGASTKRPLTHPSSDYLARLLRSASYDTRSTRRVSIPRALAH